MGSRPLILDDGVPPTHGSRGDLFKLLRQIGINVAKLVSNLLKEPDRVLLLKERRARTLETQALTGRRFTNRMLAAYEQFETRLIKSHVTVPDDVDDAVFSLIAALEVPVNHLTDRLAATGALQQRYMQHVRRVVHGCILTGLQSYEGPPLAYGGRRIVNTFDSEARAAASVDLLTAAFIQNLFPLWGATTTPDVVRKSRPRGLTQRR